MVEWLIRAIVNRVRKSRVFESHLLHMKLYCDIGDHIFNILPYGAINSPVLTEILNLNMRLISTTCNLTPFKSNIAFNQVFVHGQTHKTLDLRKLYKHVFIRSEFLTHYNNKPISIYIETFISHLKDSNSHLKFFLNDRS